MYCIGQTKKYQIMTNTLTHLPEKLTKIPEFYTIFARKCPITIRQRDRGQAEAKCLRLRPRPRPKLRGRGQGKILEAEAKILASRPIWPRGLNIAADNLPHAGSGLPGVSCSCCSSHLITRHLHVPRRRRLRTLARISSSVNAVNLVKKSVKSLLCKAVYRQPMFKELWRISERCFCGSTNKKPSWSYRIADRTDSQHLWGSSRYPIICHFLLVSFGTESLSPAVFEILRSKRIGITSLTFQCYVTSCESQYAISYWWSFETKPLSLTVSEIFNVEGRM